MKILSQTNDEMHLKDRGTASYAIGFIFICVAAAFTFFSAASSLSEKLVFAGPFWVVGLGILLLAPTLVIDIYKMTGQVRLRKKRLFIVLKDDDQSYLLSDVIKVIYRESWRRDRVRSRQSGVSSQRRNLHQQTFLGLVGEREVAIGFDRSPSTIGIGPFSFILHRDRERNHAEQVAAFLSVPLEAD